MTENSEAIVAQEQDKVRQAALQRIDERIKDMDSARLYDLERWLESAEQPGPIVAVTADKSADRLSRRQFLGTLAVSSTALVVSNAVTAAKALDRGSLDGTADAETRLLPRISTLEDLVKLYERLDDVGLDDAVSTGIAGVLPFLRTLKENGKLLLLGIGIIELALTQAERAQAAIREGIDIVREIIDRLEDRVAELWTQLGELTGVAVPIAASLAAFFRDILAKIPFGIGERIEQMIDWISELVAELPEAFASTRARLLEPLNLEWFDSESEESLDARLFTPLRTELLAPAKGLLAYVTKLDMEWEAQLQEPAEAALAERQQIRAQIQAMRRDLGDRAA